MRLRILLAAIIGTFALTSMASAQNNANSYYGTQPQGQCAEAYGSAGPIYTRFPLTYDKFPNTSQGSLESMDIAKRGGGTIPNRSAPNSISEDTITSIRVTIHYHYYIVAFLTQLQTYIAGNKPGFDIEVSQEREYINSALESIVAQAEQHALSVNLFLQSYGLEPETPCIYKLPPLKVNDYKSYLIVVAYLTDGYLGFAQSYIQRAALAGDVSFIQILVSVVQSIAERGGVLRRGIGFTPAANPFPTYVSREIYYSVVLYFLTVAGSCPNLYNINLPSFRPLVPQARPCNGVDQIISYPVQGTDFQSYQGLYVAYVNQQNSPVTVPVQNIRNEDGCTILEAIFPCSLTTFGEGLTIVSIVNNSGPFTYPDELIPFTSYFGGVYLS